MNIKSIGHKTNLIYSQVSGNIEEKDKYFVVRTPSRPDFYWGNYLLYKYGIGHKINADEAIDNFIEEFGPYDDTGYTAITFDDYSSAENLVEAFEERGFLSLKNKVLCTDTISKNDKVREEANIRPLESDRDWEMALDVHFEENWPYGTDEQQRQFLKEEQDDFRKIVSAGLGKRYGLFQGDFLMGELGVYWEDGLARFNNVATHKDYRRQGVCSNLVYAVSKIMIDQGITRLVMEADEDYHAAQIYESLGFSVFEKIILFERYK